MIPRPLRWVCLLLVVVLGFCSRAGAQSQEFESADGLMAKFSSLFPIDHSQPMSVPELCHRIDCLAEEMRDDGLIVMKQPDVFSQARMTRFRTDFDNQMSSDLANFHLVLAARINRLDAATTTSTTALGAALAAPGTTNVTAPSASASGANSVLAMPTNTPFSNGTSLFNSQIQPGQGTFGQLGLGNNNFGPGPTNGASAPLAIGVDPTVYLDEKKRFLDHLSQLRRINLGPDQNDSSGYGLYLVRLPASITPGECTYQGHGGELSVQVEHQFGPEFLPTTFRNLVINDLVDQLGPLIYELIRSGAVDDALKKYCSTLPDLDAHIDIISKWSSSEPNANCESKRQYEQFITATENSQLSAEQENLKAQSDALQKNFPTQKEVSEKLTYVNAVIKFRRNGVGSWPKEKLSASPESNQKYVSYIASLDLPHLGEEQTNLVRGLRQDYREIADKLMFVTEMLAMRRDSQVNYFGDLTKLVNSSLPSVRTAKQLYPIAPRELLTVFLPQNILILANDIKEASRTTTIRLSDVRTYLRHTLEIAYKVMSQNTQRVAEVQDPELKAQNPILANGTFMDDLLVVVKEHGFPALISPVEAGADLGVARLVRAPGSRKYEHLIKVLLQSYGNVEHTALAPLCFAIAIDAVLLDEALRDDAGKVFRKKGLPCELLESVRFYLPETMPNDEAKAVFNDYVRHRWPIITFALDPVTDQQNIADSFNLKRDLQLAVSFAFATGQINFSQMNTFRRQIEQSSDTIALNRTVTGFVHGNDNFGFRFTPRFQNPPNQRTNVGVIFTQLLSGGPGPDYQMRKSKLEPGVRELNAVLLIPTFLPEMRMNVASNWFKLNDPEHLIFHTKKMMERGRRVQELRQAAVDTCSTQQYREADLRVLQTKLDQLDVMLPMQTRVVQLPFENSANGFDLLSEGSTALVPELTGFSGVDVITLPAASSGAAAAGAATAAGGTAAASPTAASTPPPATFSITSLSTPANTQTATYTISGGTTSIADIFVFGKYISLLDTRVIAGGKSASFEILSREVVHVQIPANVIPTTTEDGKTYIEIYLATPTGISNSLLVPCTPPATPTVSPNAYDVATASQSVPVFYQWLPSADGIHRLVPTADPGKKSIGITWDSHIGLAPRQIQAQFVATINNQNVIMVFQAKAGNKDDYLIDPQQFVVTLLSRLNDITVYPALPPSSIAFTVNVQPWRPADSEGLRAKTAPKQLKSKVTVNLQYNDTGVNALPGVVPLRTPPPAAPAAGDDTTTSRFLSPGAAADDRKLAEARSTTDPSLMRTAQQLPSTSSILNATQPPLPLDTPALLAPNVTSEAEQISKMLTGRSVATTVTLAPPGIPPAVAALQGAAATSFAAAAATDPRPVAQAQMPSIVVTPSPVVVISPPPTKDKRKQHTSRVHKMINRLGNRVSQAVPQ